MKTWIFLIIGFLLLNCSIAISNKTLTDSRLSQNGSMNVLSSPDLYNLTQRLASEYSKLNPGLKINVIKSPVINMSDMSANNAEVGFVTGESITAIDNQSLWTIIVGRDVTVPIINSKNPFLDEINRKGVATEDLSRIFNNPDKQNWEMVLGAGHDRPLHLYYTDEASVGSAVEHFLKTSQGKFPGIKLTTSKEMISAVQNDPDAIGFCKLVDIVDVHKQCFGENIQLLPIDKNGNRKIDYMENIYDNLKDFSRGVWIGKYPKALSGNIYSISPAKPINATAVSFLNWVLADGQQYLSMNGYCDLVNNERETQLAKINGSAIYLTPTENKSYANTRILLLVLIALGVIGVIMMQAYRQTRKNKGAAAPIPTHFTAAFDENSVKIPKGLYFDKTHTWAFMEKDGLVKIGIDDFLQHVTGPITRIELKNAGDKIKKGDWLLTLVQKGKQLKVYAPVSGTITTHNKAVVTNSTFLNSAPYTDGWVYTIEPANWMREIQFLNMSEKYTTWLKGEFSRLKDFLASFMAKITTPEFATVVLQDGGVLKDNLLADLGPEVWEDFQTKFIDNAR